MSSEPSWKRDYDEQDNDNTWSQEWDRGSYTERDVHPDHGDHYIETIYSDGREYREYDDGRVEKNFGK